ncbi:MAG: S24 family peptidase [Nonlabens sp.]
MDDVINIEARRFKQVRQDLKLTQSQFANELSAGSTTADIERGKKKITGRIVSELLRIYQINPLWLYGMSYNKTLETHAHKGPKVITMDTSNRENMLMVPIKASAGYADNVQDTDWYDGLNSFNIPLPQFKEGSYRAFQVDGDSMTPVLQSKEWVMAKAVENLRQANDNRIHVIVTDSTVVVKKLIKQDDATTVHLVSINSEYPVIVQKVEEIKEIWEVNSHLSFDLDAPSKTDAISSLQEGLESLKKEIKLLQK